MVVVGRGFLAEEEDMQLFRAQAPFNLWLPSSCKGSVFILLADGERENRDCIGSFYGRVLKKRPELSYMAIPNGKCSLDVSPEENKNGFAKQPASVFL